MLIERIMRGAEPRRSADLPLSFDTWASYFQFGGNPYAVLGNQSLAQAREEIGSDFRGYAEQVAKSNGVVFACMLVRMLLFSEARFQFRQLSKGRPGDLFGTPALKRLETPWPNATTGDLLSRAIQDADLAGNFYGHRTVKGVERLRPDWMSILLGHPTDPNAEPGDPGIEVAGYAYHPGGRQSQRDPVVFLPGEIAHFAPIPDPLASYRGMSWLTPVIREVQADQSATEHKLRFFEAGATPNLVVSLNKDVNPQAYERYKAAFEDHHRGVMNAYETMFLGGGADVKVVGADMKQIDFKVTQGAGETRIAAAAGVPPVIVGLSEGLQAATYSNYHQARRRFADGTMRPLWRNMAGSLETIVETPSGAHLWIDDRDIAFLQDDMKDRAEIQQVQAQAIKALTEAGFTPDSARDAVLADDMGLLKHSGMFSVQLHPPGTTPPASNSNGNGNAPALPAPNGNGS